MLPKAQAQATTANHAGYCCSAMLCTGACDSAAQLSCSVLMSSLLKNRQFSGKGVNRTPTPCWGKLPYARYHTCPMLVLSTALLRHTTEEVTYKHLHSTTRTGFHCCIPVESLCTRMATQAINYHTWC